jgi:hypothetical protein
VLIMVDEWPHDASAIPSIARLQAELASTPGDDMLRVVALSGPWPRVRRVDALPMPNRPPVGREELGESPLAARCSLQIYSASSFEPPDRLPWMKEHLPLYHGR